MRRWIFLPLAGLALAACSGATSSPAWTSAPTEDQSVAVTTPVLDVYKSATCTCCHEWGAYMRSLGYTVRSFATDDLARVKAVRGLPREAWSCHTAVIEGYVVEGHVPIEAVEDLLGQRPNVDGIALAGMPPGSPGMPGAKEGPFAVLAVDDGTTSSFGHY